MDTLSYELLPQWSFRSCSPFKVRNLRNYPCPGLHSESISRLFDHGFSFRFLTHSKQIQGLKLGFIGSSNGLVLCYTTVINYNKRYYVCNALTQKWVFIPSPPNPMCCYHGVIGFFCEYSSPYTTSCYRVVRIASLSEEVWADIFCSNLGEWKTFQVSCPVNVLKEHYPCLYDNVVTHDSLLYWIGKGHKIIAYNLNNFKTDGHQFKVMEFPDDYGAYHGDHILGESEGLICYARIARRQKTLSVWVLKEDNWQSLCDGVELHNILAAMVLQKGNANSTLVSAGVAVQVVGFNPVDHDVVLLGCWNYTWEFNMRTRRFKKLCCPSLLLSNSTPEEDYMHTPFVLNPMPTIIPPLFG